MKRLLLPVLLLLAGCAPESPPAASGAQDPAAASVADPTRGGTRGGTWLHAESLKDGVPIAWDFRDDYSPLPQRTRLVVVSLGHEESFDGNTDAERQRVYDAHERSLLDGLKGRADLVAVLDWRQQHDWFFYTAAEVGREDVERITGAADSVTVQVSLEDDPQFDFYRTLQQRVHGVPEKK